MPLILGIETSCDETAAGIIDHAASNEYRIAANVIASQIKLHAPYCGVVPELASRAHLEKILPTISHAAKEAGVNVEALDAIAYTRGPGLKGALLIGETTAKALAFVLGKPLIDINHLEAHLAAALIEHPRIRPPLLGLVVSGGHTDLVLVKDWGSYRVLGRTLDDACGEALDKFAKMLGLGFPGGPIIDKLSIQGNPKAVDFPRPLQPNWNFSFSGLKTSALYWLRDNRWKLEKKKLSLEDLAASFQEAICETLVIQATQAMNSFKLDSLVVAGGVAANSRLRSLFDHAANANSWRVYFPSPKLCTDNGVMVAVTGALKLFRRSKHSRYASHADTTLPFGKW